MIYRVFNIIYIQYDGLQVGKPSVSCFKRGGDCGRDERGYPPHPIEITRIRREERDTPHRVEIEQFRCDERDIPPHHIEIEQIQCDERDIPLIASK